MSDLAAIDSRLAAIEAKLDLLAGTVMTRLLDAVVPTAEQLDARAAAGGTEMGSHDPHEPDDGSWDAATSDWTDPFIGLDRPRAINEVARLEVGEAVPGIMRHGDVAGVPAGNGARTVGETDALERWRTMGEGSFEEWNRDTHIEPHSASEVVGVDRVVAAWVAPLEV